MKATYFVMAVAGSDVTVVPDVAGSCATCKRECAKRNPGIVVANSRGFEVRPGDKVKIGSFSQAENFRGIFAILFPAACAVLGYVLPGFFTALTDAARAGSAVVFLSAGALAVFVFSKLKPAQQKLEITSKIKT